MPVSLIIAAGGSGERFLRNHFPKTSQNGRISKSKLFFPLLGKPLLVHTIEKFQDLHEINEIIVVMPPGSVSFLEKWRKTYAWKHIRGVKGGKTRAESVYNGLQNLKKKNAWVMVHDGARPCITSRSIKKLLAAAERKNADGVILAAPVIPTIKRVDLKKESVRETLDRALLFEAQTPQLVRRGLLEKAYLKKERAFHATDEAALLESVGGNVRLVRSDVKC